MKKIAIILLLTSSIAYAQTNTFPASGNVGIGTLSPNDKLHVQALGGGIIKLANEQSSYLTSQIVTMGVLRGIGLQWNNNYTSTNSNETAALKFGYYADAGGKIQDASIRFYTQDNGSGSTMERLSIVGGNVGIGTTTPGSFKLAVEGKIGAREVNVTTAAWSDYVFKEDYHLRPLAEVQEFIKENHHLPDVPSEKEVLQNGQDLGAMNAVLLRKIEELTLYVIELKKDNEEMKIENQSIRNEIQNLKINSSQK